MQGEGEGGGEEFKNSDKDFTINQLRVDYFHSGNYCRCDFKDYSI